MSDLKHFLDRFQRLSWLLEKKGWPPTSRWWLAAVRRWYESGRTQAVFRVGRRGGKSTTLSRLAVCEALYGKHVVPPGDIGVVAIISTRREEAVERLRTIKAILDALDVSYRERDMTLELTERRIMFRVYVATVAGVSGFTSIFVFCDEVSKWKDIDTGSNPADQVLKSVRPTLATMPFGKIVLSSSPLGKHDAHFDAYAEGDTDMQCVDYAPTWVANPTLTEARTKQLETDPSTWEREYRAIPQEDDDTSLLSAVLLRACQRPSFLIDKDRYRYVAAIDPATRGNAWTLVVATQNEHQVRQIVFAHEWLGHRRKPLVPSEVFAETAELLKPYGLTAVWSDQYASDALRDIARMHGVYVHIEPWTQPLKADAYEHLKSLSQEKRLELIENPTLLSDLLGIRLRLSRSGVNYDLAEEGARHSDYAPAAAMAILKCRMRGKFEENPLTLQEQHDRKKREFLLEREKERKDDDRFGLRPATHRHVATEHLRRRGTGVM